MDSSATDCRWDEFWSSLVPVVFPLSLGSCVIVLLTGVSGCSSLVIADIASSEMTLAEAGMMRHHFTSARVGVLSLSCCHKS